MRRNSCAKLTNSVQSIGFFSLHVRWLVAGHMHVWNELQWNSTKYLEWMGAGSQLPYRYSASSNQITGKMTQSMKKTYGPLKNHNWPAVLDASHWVRNVRAYSFNRQKNSLRWNLFWEFKNVKFQDEYTVVRLQFREIIDNYDKIKKCESFTKEIPN